MLKIGGNLWNNMCNSCNYLRSVKCHKLITASFLLDLLKPLCCFDVFIFSCKLFCVSEILISALSLHDAILKICLHTSFHINQIKIRTCFLVPGFTIQIEEILYEIQILIRLDFTFDFSVSFTGYDLPDM